MSCAEAALESARCGGMGLGEQWPVTLFTHPVLNTVYTPWPLTEVDCNYPGSNLDLSSYHAAFFLTLIIVLEHKKRAAKKTHGDCTTSLQKFICFPLGCEAGGEEPGKAAKQKKEHKAEDAALLVHVCAFLLAVPGQRTPGLCCRLWMWPW